MTQWYYANGTDRKGPVDENAFEALVANGLITDSTLVWHEGLAEWQPYSAVKAGGSPAAPAVAAATAASGTGQSISLGGQTVTEATKEEYVQRMREGVNTMDGQHHYAGFWIRVVAVIIDGIITNIAAYAIIIPLALIFGGTAMDALEPEAAGVGFAIVSMVISFGIPLAYYIITTGSSMQATFGKKALGLKVIRENGEKVTYALATGRYFGYILSSLIIGIGLIMAAFDKQKRSLHDHMCGTRVIYR